MGQILNKFCPPPKKRKTKQWESRVTELLNFLFLITWESKFYRNSFSLSLFVMLVTNSIFFSFLKKKNTKIYFTQDDYGPWNTNLGPLAERKQVFV